MAEKYPRVSISGSFALQGQDIGDTINADSFLLQAGPRVSIPIFDSGRITSRITQAQSEQRQALSSLRQHMIQVVAEVETAEMRRSHAEERVSRLLTSQAAASDTEALALDRFDAGSTDFLDVVEARSERLIIERTRVLAQRDAILRLIDLYVALGGGWEPTHSETNAQ